MRRSLLWIAILIALCVEGPACSRPSPSLPVSDRNKPTESEDELPGGLTQEAFPRLVKWLQADGSGSTRMPSRDVFQRSARAATSSLVMAPEPPMSAERSPVAVDQPRLEGFVFGGGRVERPVAAIHFEGRMWLVGVGDPVGPYRVEELVVGEEAYLVDPESGETLRLTIK